MCFLSATKHGLVPEAGGVDKGFILHYVYKTRGCNMLSDQHYFFILSSDSLLLIGIMRPDRLGWG